MNLLTRVKSENEIDEHLVTAIRKIMMYKSEGGTHLQEKDIQKRLTNILDKNHILDYNVRIKIHGIARLNSHRILRAHVSS